LVDQIKKVKKRKLFSLFHLVYTLNRFYLFWGDEGRGEFELEFIGRCWRKRLRFRLRAFTDFNFAFWPGGMK
jgi:hypothetical protein